MNSKFSRSLIVVAMALTASQGLAWNPFSYVRSVGEDTVVTKPAWVEMELQVPVEIGAANTFVAYSVLNGSNNSSCWVYNYNTGPVSLPEGTKIRMRAAYWEGEPSWNDNNHSGISISCSLGRIKNYNERVYRPNTVPMINEDLAGQLKLTVVKDGK